MTTMTRPASARRLSPLLALTLATAFGCRSATTVPDSSVTAAVVAQGIRVTNRTDHVACYWAIERLAWQGMSSLTEACARSSGVLPLSPKQELLVPWSQVAAFNLARTEYMVFWSLPTQGEAGHVTVSTAGVALAP